MKPPGGTPEELWYLRGFEAAVLQLRTDERAAIVALAKRVIEVYHANNQGFAANAIHGLVVAIERGEHLGKR